MFDNIDTVDNLRGLARTKSRDYETKTVHPSRVQEFLSEGWNVDRKSSRSVRLRRSKGDGQLFRDRIWVLLYRMGFSHLSLDPNVGIIVDPKQPESSQRSLDILGIDSEIVVAIECRFSEKYAKAPQLQDDIGELALLRERTINSVNTHFPSPFKRQLAVAMFVSNISLSEADRAKAARSV